MKTKTVQHVARLANLKLTPRELKKLQGQLGEILDYVEILNRLDTKGVEPTSQITGLENVFRDDEPEPSFSQEEALSEAKEKKNNFFKVKAVLER